MLWCENLYGIFLNFIFGKSVERNLFSVVCFQKTNILLGSEENAVGVHTAKGFAGLQQPPLDSAQKEPCLDRSSSLSDISTTTIGEMNDRADYVKMAKVVGFICSGRDVNSAAQDTDLLTGPHLDSARTL